MLPLYNHQHPVQVIKAQNQENHNISPSQPQVRGGAMAMARNHGISITNCLNRGVKPCHYPGLDNLLMNKKAQTIVDIIGTW